MIFDIIIFFFVILVGLINIFLPAWLHLPVEWMNAVGYFLGPLGRWDWAFPFIATIDVVGLLIGAYAVKRLIKSIIWFISLIRGGSGESPV